jgi:hypothetical protein
MAAITCQPPSMGVARLVPTRARLNAVSSERRPDTWPTRALRSGASAPMSPAAAINAAAVFWSRLCITATHGAATDPAQIPPTFARRICRENAAAPGALTPASLACAHHDKVASTPCIGNLGAR